MARGHGRAHRSSRHEFGDRDVARIRAAGAARLLWCGKLRGAASIKIGSRLSSSAVDTRRRSPSQKRARTVLGGDVVGSEPTASLRQPALFLLSWPTRGRVPAGGSAKTRRKSRWWSSASPVPQNTTKMGNKSSQNLFSQNVTTRIQYQKKTSKKMEIVANDGAQAEPLRPSSSQVGGCDPPFRAGKRRR